MSDQGAPRARRYTFEQVQRALHDHWGLTLGRGGSIGDGKHDGRWTVEYSKTGFVVGGQLPGQGYGYRRYETLAQIVAACDLGSVLR